MAVTETERRFPQLKLEDLDATQRPIADGIVKFAGGIGGPFNMMLRDPSLADLCFKLGNQLLFSTPLPRRLVEMAVLIRARYSMAQLEWVAHRRRATEAGLAEPVMDALAAGKRPPAMAPDEAALFDFSVELLKSPAVSAGTFDRAKSLFGERGVVDLTAIIGFYGMVSLMLKAAEVGGPGGQEPLQHLDDPFPLD